MSRSEDKTDIWGDKYTVHYDDDGNKVGESREETDIWGDTYTEHSDTKGHKTGESVEKTDIWGDRYTEHTEHGSRGTSKTAKAINESSGVSKNQSGCSNTASSTSNYSTHSLSLSSPAVLGIAIVAVSTILGQALMFLGSFLTGLPNSADGVFELLLLIPVGIVGIGVWLLGFLLSLPLYAAEHVTGLCLAIAPAPITNANNITSTATFCN